MKSATLFVLFATAFIAVLANDPYAGNPACGWGGQTYRAVGDWAQDAGSGQNWDPAESKGIMTATMTTACEYQAVVRGLKPGKTYYWKVTINGENTGWATQWGCVGNVNPPACQFQADSTGGVTFKIVASNAYTLSTSPAPGSSSGSGSGSGTGSGGSSTTGGGGGGGSSSGKLVFAHYMMGFAYGSDENFFQGTIALAQSIGIDAFAVNVGNDPTHQINFQKFLNAANAKNFKLFISLDTDAIPDINMLSSWVNNFVDNPAYFRYNNRPFVSTFGGDGRGSSFWTNWKNNNVGSKNIYFCPNFFGDDLAANYDKFPSIDCLFSWDAWQKDISNARDVPAIQKAHSQGKTYMAGVAPWFYCHLPQQEYGVKNWFWPSGPDNGADNIWSIRWRQAIASGADFAEIITWNDYSESSYIAPLSQEVPGFCSSYVNGMDHSAFLKMAAYYVPYFKNGVPPAIKQNQVFFWYRIHGRNEWRNDQFAKPHMFWSTPGDCVAVHTISGSTGGVVHVNIGGRDSSFTINQQEQDACIPFNGVGAVRVTVQRNGQSYSGDVGPDVEGSGNLYNFNVWTGSISYPV